MFNKLIAKEGCVLLFPKRLDSKKEPAFIFSRQEARPGFGEEWLQIRIALIPIKIERAGAESVLLGAGVRCDARAEVRTVIDRTCLKDLLPKVLASFGCAPRESADFVFEATYFDKSLKEACVDAFDETFKTASVEALLEDDEFHAKLEVTFDRAVRRKLDSFGFVVKHCELKISDPVLPDVPEPSAWGQKVYDKIEVFRLRRKERELSHKKSKADLEIRESDFLRDMEIKKKEAEEKRAASLRQLAESSQQEKEAHEQKMGEFTQRQQDRAREIRTKDREDDHAEHVETEKRSEKLRILQAEHRNEDCKRQLLSAKGEKDLLGVLQERARAEGEIAKLKMDTEAYGIEKRALAESAVTKQAAEIELRGKKIFMEQLAQITKELPRGPNESRFIVVNLGTSEANGIPPLNGTSWGTGFDSIMRSLMESAVRLTQPNPTGKPEGGSENLGSKAG